MSDYYLLLEDKPTGPLKAEDVREMLAAGSITMDTLWSEDGATEWKAVRQEQKFWNDLVPAWMKSKNPYSPPPHGGWLRAEHLDGLADLWKLGSYLLFAGAAIAGAGGANE